ncbi:MAG: hypothetical protein H7Y17_09820 [Chlorobia bacterium]|nr:hypothetical protein [Fimbriimonadaceae bacterium]
MATFAACIAIVAMLPQGLTTPPIATALRGPWVGTLEYRDYQSGDRVRVATMLRITPASDGKTFVFRYIYDDGPSKIIESKSDVIIDGSTYSVKPADEAATVYRLSGLEKVKADGTGTLTLDGDGTENGAKVVVRVTVRVQRDSLTFLRESKLEGKDWAFRNEYRFSRVVQPKKGKPS